MYFIVGLCVGLVVGLSFYVDMRRRYKNSIDENIKLQKEKDAWRKNYKKMVILLTKRAKLGRD